ncbi:MAG: hypothetical protein WD050_05515 [Actinomycetota bacterium]
MARVTATIPDEIASELKDLPENIVAVFPQLKEVLEEPALINPAPILEAIRHSLERMTIGTSTSAVMREAVDCYLLAVRRFMRAAINSRGYEQIAREPDEERDETMRGIQKDAAKRWADEP